MSELIIDRGEQYPLILEDVIKNAITPIMATQGESAHRFALASTEPMVSLDHTQKPADVMGHEGMTINVGLNLPAELSRPSEDGEDYRLVLTTEGPAWAPMFAVDNESSPATD